MTRFLPRALALALPCAVFTLIVSLAPPLPVLNEAFAREEHGGQGASSPLWGEYKEGQRPSLAAGGIDGQETMSDPQAWLFQRALNYGMGHAVGWANSMGEAAFTGLFDKGRARLNFMVDMDGRVSGEGDLLYPFYDGRYSTVFTQIGVRSMSGMSGPTSTDRWIGNFGLGQRWYFPRGDDDAARRAAAQQGSPHTEQAGDRAPLRGDAGDSEAPAGRGAERHQWMLGYNVFFDNDFTRSHQRGGVGVEAQYDWLKLAANYYFPLSSWKGSYDFDSRFVEERPARGWDLRVKGALPFYRNLAVTGAYSRWYGDRVGMFSSADLEKDPKVWSYGLEYTPVPLVSAFWNQRSTERGRSDTEFGIRFTYHFGMSWEDQTSHDKVADLRTVSASRHAFVERENRIVLEYRARNAYHIEYLGPDGARGFLFRVVDGFGAYKAGQTVRVTTSGTWLAEAAPAKAAPAEARTVFAQAVDVLDGLISVKAAYAAGFSAKNYVTDDQGRFWVQLDATAPDPTPVAMTAGESSQNFTLPGNSGGGGGGGGGVYGLVAAQPTLSNGQSTTLTLTAPANASVSWAVDSALGVLSAPQADTDASGKATATLTAAGSSGTVTVTATVDGQDYACTVTLGLFYTLEFGTVTGAGANVAFSGLSQTATIPVTLKLNGVGVGGQTVTWSVERADNSANVAVTSNYLTLTTGLAWGGTPKNQTGAYAQLETISGTKTATTNASGMASIQLTDIMGERTVYVKASVVVNGQTIETPNELGVTFGKGPLQYFKAPVTNDMAWSGDYPVTNSTVSFPLAVYCGGSVTTGDPFYNNSSWEEADHFGFTYYYARHSKLPRASQLQAVTGGTGRGAAFAAGWPNSHNTLWTGELQKNGSTVFLVAINTGNLTTYQVNYSEVLPICLR